jgi:hypothetical protein
MKKRNFIDSITIRLSSRQRRAIEKLSLEEEKGLGEVTREILDLGLRSKGLEA